MRADGNPDQWSAPGFPPDDLLLRDIARGGGYVIEDSWPVTAGHETKWPAVVPGNDGTDRTIVMRDEDVPEGPAVMPGNDDIDGAIVKPGEDISERPAVMPGLTGHLAAPRPVAYFALLPSPEPTYEFIDGAWLTDEPYGVIHRIASYPDVHGVFSAIINFAAVRYPHLRIDTHRDNRIMQHVIAAAGFTCCGIIWLPDGTERLAYER